MAAFWPARAPGPSEASSLFEKRLSFLLVLFLQESLLVERAGNEMAPLRFRARLAAAALPRMPRTERNREEMEKKREDLEERILGDARTPLVGFRSSLPPSSDEKRNRRRRRQQRIVLSILMRAAGCFPITSPDYSISILGNAIGLFFFSTRGKPHRRDVLLGEERRKTSVTFMPPSERWPGNPPLRE